MSRSGIPEGIPGTIDESVLSSITDEIKDEHDQFADYLTIREISYVTRLSIARIRHGVTYAKVRPLTGIKRGPLWFVRRTEALRWAAAVAQWELQRWSRNADRIERMIARDAKRFALPAPKRFGYQPPPDGAQVYTYAQAQEVLDYTPKTLITSLAPSGPLRHVERYLTVDRQVVVNAEQIDAYARTTRRFHQENPARKGPRRGTPLNADAAAAKAS